MSIFKQKNLISILLAIFSALFWACSSSPEYCPNKVFDLRQANDIDGLVLLLKDSDPKVRMHTARALGDFGSYAKSSVPLLKKATQDENARVSLWSYYALASIEEQSEQYIQAVSRAIYPAGGEQYVILCDAVNCLKRLGSKARIGVPSLIDALEFPYAGSLEVKITRSYEMWSNIRISMQASPDPQIREIGGSVFKDSNFPDSNKYEEIKTDPIVSKLALEALVVITGKDFGYDPDKWLSWLETAGRPIDPAQILGQNPDLETLKKYSQHESDDVRLAVVVELGKHDLSKEQGDFLQLLKKISTADNNWKIRRKASVLLIKAISKKDK